MENISQEFKSAIRKAGNEVSGEMYSKNHDTKQMIDTLQSASQLANSVKELPEEVDIENKKITDDEILNVFDRILMDISNEKEETKEATGAASAGGYSAPLFSKDKIDEQEERTDYSFNKSTYIPEEKAIVAPYMIIDETDKSIVVLNIQEIENKGFFWADNKKAYTIRINKIRLPKSQIQILDDVEGKDGFNYIKIPYWLYKKSNAGLDIIRILTKNKRIKISSKETKDELANKILSDENIIKYFNQIKSPYDDSKLGLNRLNEEFLGEFSGEEIYKNPKSINRMGLVRAISDEEGNLYVINAVGQLHGSFALLLSLNKIAFEQIRDKSAAIYQLMRDYKCILWEGEGNTFYFSDSQQKFYFKLASISNSGEFDNEALSKIDNLINAVENKNPQFNFYISEDFEEVYKQSADVTYVNEDEIPGGLADNISVEGIAKKHKVSTKEINKQLIMGIKVEMEHTNSKELAREIALDHLYEIPDYYTRLAKMEKDSESKKVEAKEATDSSSSGSYETPSFLAKNPKNWRGASKTMFPGGKFVQIKGKCKTYPYCNQGDINAIKLFENVYFKEAIDNISKKYNIDKAYIKSVILEKLLG